MVERQPARPGGGTALGAPVQSSRSRLGDWDRRVFRLVLDSGSDQGCWLGVLRRPQAQVGAGRFGQLAGSSGSGAGSGAGSGLRRKAEASTSTSGAKFSSALWAVWRALQGVGASSREDCGSLRLSLWCGRRWQRCRCRCRRRCRGVTPAAVRAEKPVPARVPPQAAGATGGAGRRYGYRQRQDLQMGGGVKISLHDQRTHPSEMRNWSGTTLNLVAQKGSR